jgi:phosphopantetheine adenylyltransferase
MNTATLCRIVFQSEEAQEWLEDNIEELGLQRWQIQEDCLVVDYAQSEKIKMLMQKEGLEDDEDFEIR